MPSRRARVALDWRRRHAPRVCAALVGELHAVYIRGTPTLPVSYTHLRAHERTRQRKHSPLYTLWDGGRVKNEGYRWDKVTERRCDRLDA